MSFKQQENITFEIFFMSVPSMVDFYQAAFSFGYYSNTLDMNVSYFVAVAIGESFKIKLYFKRNFLQRVYPSSFVVKVWTKAEHLNCFRPPPPRLTFSI